MKNSVIKKLNYCFFLIVFFVILFIFAPQQIFADSENLMINGDFEQSENNLPKYFYFKADSEAESSFSLNYDNVFSGNSSLCIEAKSPDKAKAIIKIKVKPNTYYKIHANIMGENIGTNNNGAHIAAISGDLPYEYVYDTAGQWLAVDYYGKTGPKQYEVELYAGIGTKNSLNTGKVYFDDISLVELSSNSEIKFISKLYSYNNRFNSKFLPLIALIYTLIAFIAIRYIAKVKNNEGSRLTIFAIILAAIIARVYVALYIPPHFSDTNLFVAWSHRIYELGPARFYSSDFFCDYPPIYIYLLWPFGALSVNKIIAPEFLPLLYKMHSIIFDILTGIVIYKISCKKFSRRKASIISALYLFNPMILANGVAWGQVDVIWTFIIMLMLVSLYDNKWQWAIPLYILAILTKPQALIFGPLALITIFIEIRKKLIRKEKLDVILKQIALGLFYGLLLALIVIIPFSLNNNNPFWIFEKYQSTLESYSFSTVNTTNLYYLLGNNWQDIGDVFFRKNFAIFCVILILILIRMLISLRKKRILPYPMDKIKTFALQINKDRDDRQDFIKTIYFMSLSILLIFLLAIGLFSPYFYNLSGLFIIFTFCLAATIMLVDSNKTNISFWMALVIASVFISGTRMHERYIYISLMLFLLHFIYTQSLSGWIFFTLFSISGFLNTAYVLYDSIYFNSRMDNLANYPILSPLLALFNCILLIACHFAIYEGYYRSKTISNNAINTEKL